MSEFVNYKKRSVSLPPGCKDLIDLLRQKSNPEGISIPEQLNPASSLAAPPLSNEWPVVTRGENIVGTLLEISMHIARVCDASAHLLTLMICPPDERLTVILSPQNGRIETLVVLARDPEREAAMNDFSETHSIPLLLPMEDSNQPQLYFPIPPLPLDAAPLSTLATELFREVGGLSDTSTLRFYFYELSVS